MTLKKTVVRSDHDDCMNRKFDQNIKFSESLKATLHVSDNKRNRR